MALDPIGWYIATTHQMLGHAKAAAVLGQDPGDATSCIICWFERGEATREDVERALAPDADPEELLTWVPHPPGDGS